MRQLDFTGVLVRIQCACGGGNRGTKRTQVSVRAVFSVIWLNGDKDTGGRPGPVQAPEEEARSPISEMGELEN